MLCPNCNAKMDECTEVCDNCGLDLSGKKENMNDNNKVDIDKIRNNENIEYKDNFIEEDDVESVEEDKEGISIVDTYKKEEKISIDEISELEKKDTTSIFNSLKVGEEFLSMKIEKIIGKSYSGFSLLLSDYGELLFCKLIESYYYKSYDDFYKHVEKYQKLNTENKFKIYDYGREKEVYYVISSYLRGKTLKKVIKEKGNFELDSAIVMVLQLIDELKKLDGKFSHRMINPENIILDENNNLFLLDFGIYYSLSPSAILRISSYEDEYTDFIAPERINNTPSIDPALADVFSIGVILNLLLTGKTPQNSSNMLFLKDERKSKQISKFIDTCSHPNPNKRFQNLSILSSVLLSIVSDEVKIDNKKSKPPTLSVPPSFKPASIKDSKLNLPIKEKVNEFDIYKNKKGDVTLGELDDVERWFFVKDGIDYGPVSAKKIRELVESKALTPDSVIKTLTHPIKKGKIKEIELFQNFLKDFSLKNSEAEMQEKMKSFKRKKIFTSIFVLLLVLVVGVGIYYINSRPKAKRFKKRTKEEIVLDGKKLKEQEELAKKQRIEREKKIEEEINKELDKELKNNSKNVKDRKEKEKKIKKKGKKYYRKYLAMKRKRQALAKKRAKMLAEKKAKEEKERMFNRNREENKDIASIGFEGKKAKSPSNSEIRQKINTKKRDIMNCFVAEYNRGNDLPSSLSITYSLRQNGRFYDVTIQHPKYRKKRGKLNYCIIKAFSSIAFAPFNGTTKVGRMPLEFSFE